MPGPALKVLPADIILVRGNDWISRDIEKITHSTYSHVAIVVNETTLIEAQGFQKVSYKPISAYAGVADVKRNNVISMDTRKKIVQQAETHLGTHYDYLLIAWELLRYTTGIVLPFHEFHSLICSTLVKVSYEGVGIDPTPGIRYPAPADVALSRTFAKVGAL